MVLSPLQTIERPTVRDHSELTALWEASVRASHHFLREDDLQYFKKIVHNEALYAVTLYCIRAKCGMIEGFMGVADGKLEMLFVHPASMGNGVGAALLQYAIHKLGIRRVDVNEQNAQAVRFYQKHGFHTINRTAVDSLGKPYPILEMQYTSR